MFGFQAAAPIGRSYGYEGAVSCASHRRTKMSIK
jgi:hypothetical protein